MDTNKQQLKPTDQQLAFEAINNLLIIERLKNIELEHENSEMKSDYARLAKKYDELLDKMSGFHEIKK